METPIEKNALQLSHRVTLVQSTPHRKTSDFDTPGNRRALGGLQRGFLDVPVSDIHIYISIISMYIYIYIHTHIIYKIIKVALGDLKRLGPTAHRTLFLPKKKT